MSWFHTALKQRFNPEVNFYNEANETVPEGFNGPYSTFTEAKAALIRSYIQERASLSESIKAIKAMPSPNRVKDEPEASYEVTEEEVA